jgi:hypothetical protein
MRRNRNDGPGEYLAAFLIWMLIAGFGAFVLRTGIRTLRDSWAVQTGITAPATLTSSLVLTRTGQRGGVTFEPAVEYSFVYQGRSYLGTRLRAEPVSFFSFSAASHYLSTLPAQLVAHFDPSAPHLAVLDPTVGSQTAVSLLIGSGVMTGVTLAICVFPPRRKFPHDDLPIDTSRIENGFLTRANHGGPKAWLVIGFFAVGIGLTVASISWMSPRASFTNGSLALITAAPPAVATLMFGWLRWRVPRQAGGVVLDETRAEVRVLPWSGRWDLPERVIPFEQVLNLYLRLRIQPSHTQKAQFTPVLGLADGSSYELRRHIYYLDTAAEWEDWARDVLRITRGELTDTDG